jgi:uracil-DNA glycosylase
MRDALPDRETLATLVAEIRRCTACAAHLPLGPRPVLRVEAPARILIVGHAPGARVHASGVPWDDPSGDRLRAWMGVDLDAFHDGTRIAIAPMGFCYPGRGAGGDNPPRRECAALWRPRLDAALAGVEVTLLIGAFAQRHYLGRARKSSLTATVAAWRDYAPRYFPLPHPSPRNTPWFQREPWFERDLVPALRATVAAAMAQEPRARGTIARVPMPRPR